MSDAATPSPRRLWEIFASDVGLTVLLVSLVLVVFVIFPFAPLDGLGRVVVSIFLTAVLISGAASLADRPRLRWVVIALAALSLVSRWACDFVDSTNLLLWSHVSTILFLALTAGGVLAKVIRQGRITSHRIQGAVAVYLMLGLIWGFAYSCVELAEPGSFRLPAAATADAAAADDANLRDLAYFSFVTLTTLGYGDVTPLRSGARSLAIFEALVGQLYLVILIARLVSLQIAHSRERI